MRAATQKEFLFALSVAGHPTPRRMHTKNTMDAIYSDRGTEVAQKTQIMRRGKVVQEMFLVNDAYLDKKRNAGGGAGLGAVREATAMPLIEESMRTGREVKHPYTASLADELGSYAADTPGNPKKTPAGMRYVGYDEDGNRFVVTLTGVGGRGLGRVRPYPVKREQFALAGTARSTKTTACASSHGKWAWMRLDPCVKKDSVEGVPQLADSKDVFKFLKAHVDFVGRGVEYMMVLSVDVKMRPMGVAVVAQGGRSSAAVDNAVVLQSPLLVGATSFMIAHNHPSQDPAPSDADIALTKVLVKSAHAVSLSCLDHLVIGSNGDRYYSFNDAGVMPRVA